MNHDPVKPMLHVPQHDHTWHFVVFVIGCIVVGVVLGYVLIWLEGPHDPGPKPGPDA